jgi:hypothetical protein
VFVFGGQSRRDFPRGSGFPDEAEQNVPGLAAASKG